MTLLLAEVTQASAAERLSLTPNDDAKNYDFGITDCGTRQVHYDLGVVIDVII